MTEDTKKREAEAQYREIYNVRVFVIGGGFQYMKMFFDAGMKGARSVEDADVVCFTGGEDVSPFYYGEEPLPVTHSNLKRDEYESGIFGEALALKKPMIGICRGSQFLNVMNGGSIWQDVNNHAGKKHSVRDMRTGGVVEGMTSTHHQQMRPAKDAEVIAVAGLSTKKVSATETVSRSEPLYDDVEAVWYASTNTLCFQPHPEFEEGPCRDYFLDLVDDFILPLL